MSIEAKGQESSSVDGADAVLAKYWDTNGKRKYPVNPLVIVERMGGKVFPVELDDDFAGVILRTEDRPLTILLNRHDDKKEQGMTIAHQIGHLIASPDKPVDFVEERFELSRNCTDALESRCNNFSYSLMMPEDTVREWHAKRYSPKRMARKFGVPLRAVQRRLEDLELTRCL